MKLYISALLLSMAKAQDNLVTRWQMDNAVINYDGASRMFTLRFETASKENHADGMATSFWDKRCKDTPDGVNQQLGAGLVEDSAESGNVPKLAMVNDRPELKFKVNTLKMVATTTDAAYANERPYAQTDGVGKLEFCVRTGLGFTSNPVAAGSTPNANTMYTSSYQEVNYIETLVTINYNLDAGVTVSGFNVAPKERVGTTKTEEYKDALEAYLCTGAQHPSYDKSIHATYNLKDAVWIPNVEVQDDESPFNQGALINICLRIKEEYIVKGARIRAVNSFDFERANNDFIKVTSAQVKGENVLEATSLFQNAILAGAASTNYLTSFDPNQCADVIACDFASVLFAEFYATSGTVVGNGKATLRFLSNANDAPYKIHEDTQTCPGNYDSIETEADCNLATEYLIKFAESVAGATVPEYEGSKESSNLGCYEGSPNSNEIEVAWYNGETEENYIHAVNVVCKRGDGDVTPIPTQAPTTKPPTQAPLSGTDGDTNVRGLAEGNVESRRLQDGAGQISAVVSIPVNGNVEGPGDLKTAGSATLGATVFAAVAAVVGAIVLA